MPCRASVTEGGSIPCVEAVEPVAEPMGPSIVRSEPRADGEPMRQQRDKRVLPERRPPSGRVRKRPEYLEDYVES